MRVERGDSDLCAYRVLQVLRPMQGGMRRHVLDLIDGLLQEGHLVQVAGPKELLNHSEFKKRVPCTEIDLCDGVHPLADLRAALQLRRLMVREPFDLVHLHGAKAGLVGRMAMRFTAHRPPVVYTVHNHVLPRRGLLRRALQTVERRLAGQTDRVIAVSNSLQQEVLKRQGLQRERAVTIHNGTDLLPLMPREYARAILGCEDEGRLMIGAIGRMVPEKGFDVLLRAFLRLISHQADVDLVLIGDGPNLSEYQQLAGKIGLARVRFLGEVAEAGRLLGGLDLVVQPSLSEGLGMVAIEAMLAGLPVIASRVGGLPEVVVHGESGWLVPAGDEEALAAALEHLIRSPQLRERLARQGQKRAEQLFSRQAMMRSILQEYEAVVQGRLAQKGMQI